MAQVKRLSLFACLSCVAIVCVSALLPSAFANMTQQVEGIDTLRAVQVIIRHGDRAPIRPWPYAQDQHDVWNCQPVQLCSIPVRQGPYDAAYLDQPAPEFGVTTWNSWIADEFEARRNDQAAAELTPTHRVFHKRYLSTQGGQLRGTCYPGQLTAQGRAQHRALGRMLRNRFRPFLGDTLDVHRVRVRSSDIPRTVESVESLLQGLFPDDNSPTVVPVHTVELEEEYLFPNKRRCPAVATLMHAKTQTQPWEEFEASPTMKALRAALGLPLDARVQWTDLYDNLNCRANHGKPLPPDVNTTTARAIFDAAEYWMAHMWEDTAMQRMTMGLFVHELMANFEQHVHGHMAVQSPTSPQLWLYSGHDTTLGPLLHIFDAYDNQWPPYASAMLLELHKDPAAGKWHVVLSYNGKRIRQESWEQWLKRLNDKNVRQTWEQSVDECHDAD